MKKIFSTNTLFWAIYLCLLMVLFPHAAWWFNGSQGHGISEGKISWMAWALAAVFEASILAFTHRLKGQIEHSQRLRQRQNEIRSIFLWRRFTVAYLNLSAFGLLLAAGISALANFSYAVEFAKPFVIANKYALPSYIYEIASGGILPVMSLLFARILAENIDTADEQDIELIELKRNERKLQRAFEQANSQNSIFRERLAMLEALSADNKAERIRAAVALFPDINNAAIAQITSTAPSYVGEVLTNNGKHDAND